MCKLLLLTLTMKSKDLSLPVKQAIMSFKYQNKPIRAKAKTNQINVWYISKTKECTGEIRNTKRPGRPQRTETDEEHSSGGHESVS